MMFSLKKATSVALAVIMLGASLFGGCSAKDENMINSNITVTSSSAESAAEVLSRKLPELSSKVILGVEADAVAYGVDLSDFESDGYVIKAQDDAVLLFGKSETGLTTAANKFANQYKSGAIENVAFHEGYRIEKLEIFDVDISEYTIEYPAENNANMLFAVSELKQLVKKATGVELASYEGDSGAEHVIEFRFSEDESLRDEGYRYYDENGTLVLEGAVARGCMNAVYRFLQNECGWDELIGGESVLQESDYVNVPAGIDKTETPAFDYLFIHNQIWERFSSDRIGPNYEQNSYGAVSNACHGLQSGNFFQTHDFISQPCFTDEEAYEICFDNLEKYIAARYNDPAFKAVDIAQYDSGSYCFCESCIEVFMEEGNTHSGAVVRFANRISEEMSEKYPGLVYKIFAYLGTNEPPAKTVPNDMVYVTYCFDMNCSNHPLDGSECGDDSTVFGKKNTDYAKWFEGWCDITDNVYVWFYSLDTNFHDYTVIDTIYNDFTYMAKNGVKGVFWQSTNHGLGMKRIHHQLGYNLNWDIDMTEEEYYALCDRLFEKEYGPGWELVRDYENILNKAQDIMGCWHCWGWTQPTQVSDAYYDTHYFSSIYDYAVSLMEQAIEMAETPAQIKRCEMLMISVLYKGCYSEYFVAYENDDTERIAVLSERFDRAMELMKKYGFNLNGEVGKYTTIDGAVCEFRYKSIEEAAWIDWYIKWDDICPGHERPEPEEYVDAVRKPASNL